MKPSAGDRPILLWSPDSKRIATFQQDQRGVGEMFLVETKVGHPTLKSWKYPLPGDEVVSTAPPCATTSPAAAENGPTCDRNIQGRSSCQTRIAPR
jgi:hypothetical protein